MMNDIQLSRHFRLSEFTRSATAIRHGIDNEPDVDSVEALQNLCIHVLEPLRRRFGVIRITSGYRSLRLNEAIGGARRSQHLFGEAADIHVGSLEMARKYFDYVRENLDFDQMLLEMKAGKVHCLHVSYRADEENRHRISSHYSV
ncbi:MAG: D-Ala-D-Ala carboxypeptidase family metallohydrolase [Prevotellaceae bacterium]|nr:D-Ala-D-Ala carboxypeptidase family metallohydrolase [Prevotellaceae bacterium]MDO4932865.1 D-Ala-D-Ala carboxypeptidase family metallohydrolase [Prevotellaceae bacterium]